MSELIEESLKQSYSICSTGFPNDLLEQGITRLPTPQQDSHEVYAARPLSIPLAIPSTPHLQSKPFVEDPVTPNNQIFNAQTAKRPNPSPGATLSPLPSVSPTYFCQDPPEIIKQRDCFIFYDPELNLPPQPIRPTDFNKPLPQSLPNPPTKAPLSPYGPLQLQRLLDFVQVVDVNNYAMMAKPAVNVNETLGNQAAIKQKITLSDKDFKELQKHCFIYVARKETLCKPVPRPWKQKWIGITEEFLEREGFGERYFNSERATFDEDSSLLWSEDKTAISYLVYSLLKQEASKAFSVKGANKRKSLLSDDVPGVAKKTKLETLSATGSKGTTVNPSLTAGSGDSTEDENDEEENLLETNDTEDADMIEFDEAEGDAAIDSTKIAIDRVGEDGGQGEDEEQGDDEGQGEDEEQGEDEGQGEDEEQGEDGGQGDDEGQDEDGGQGDDEGQDEEEGKGEGEGQGDDSIKDQANPGHPRPSIQITLNVYL